MTAVLIGQFEPGSPEWHAARTNGVGGSEIAPILGLSPFESRFSLWHRKGGFIPPVDVSPEMEWGNRLEGAVMQKFLDNHPEWHGVPSATFHHPDRPWQIANPDLLLFDAPGYSHTDMPCELLEAKTTKYDDEWGEPGTDQVPIYYRCQVLWYLDVFGLRRCRIAVLIGGSDYREYFVDYDDADAQLMRESARRFLDTLNTGQRPSPDDGSEVTWQTVRVLHPEIDGTEVEVPDDLARDYIAASLAAKGAEVEASRTKSLLAELMGSAKKAMWNGTPIASRQARNGGTPYIVAARKPPVIPPKEEAA